jgi:molybdopterin-containing oxidoreductase family iron-sulfur binding subunit
VNEVAFLLPVFTGLRPELSSEMNRRTFLKVAGVGSVAFAAGCGPESPKHLYSPVRAPEDMVTGQATWYASTCRECPAGCGILAKNREGRVIKLEGNPLHPVNRGALCMRGQAALQAVYHPDRLRTPLLRDGQGFRPVSFAEARARLAAAAREAARRGEARVSLVTEVVGEIQLELFRAALTNWNSPGPVVFEPFAYEALKSANREVFGVDGLASYRIQDADLLVSFGADFLETWLSPVEYAWKFKAMHALHGAEKGMFIHVGPCQGLTGANADQWLACAPGGEAAVALGLVRQMIASGRTAGLSADSHGALRKTVADYTPERVAALSGIPAAQLEMLAELLSRAHRPLVLGSGSGHGSADGLKTHIAVNLLNGLLDPELERIDAADRHRVETADRRAVVAEEFKRIAGGAVDLLLLNNVNPVFTLPAASGIRAALEDSTVFVVSFAAFIDETAQLADLILPTCLPLETWDVYSGRTSALSTLQPVMGRVFEAPSLGDVILEAGFEEKDRPAPDYNSFIADRLQKAGRLRDEVDWLQMLQRGGLFAEASAASPPKMLPGPFPASLLAPGDPLPAGLAFAALPSLRFFDGRGANRPWLCEIPDPISRVAWQSPVWLHPDTARAQGLVQEEIVRIAAPGGNIEAPVYITETVRPGLAAMGVGQGHTAYGRWAQQVGANPFALLPAGLDPVCGGPSFTVFGVRLEKSGRSVTLAHTDGSRTQHGRTFILSVTLDDLRRGAPRPKSGLTMGDFPLTLPLPEGYDPSRDFYPAHEHDGYRWGMTVDLDRCIGCGACAAACYAENSIGIVGEKLITQGREMAWLEVVRYHDERRMERVMFLPMLCQHCDNAPCEAVCPVYAPHHSAEGINNQIYNRCIGTRFCSQNCPYKVRRFNWFDWEWPEPMNLQLNPDVTVRSKGVMEKCSFCIQRIKAARTRAKNEKRPIGDGEVVPACVQTCPTGALVFGSLMDQTSRVRRLAEDPRAYQAMGYLNTKPAVIYLKKVLHEI